MTIPSRVARLIGLCYFDIGQCDSDLREDVYNSGDWVLPEGGMIGIVMLLQCYGSSGTREEQELRWSARIA